MARVLIIDDDVQFRSMLRQSLERAGYEVLEAPDGRVGMRVFREKQVHLVITDVVMPEKEGLETIMTLRRECPDVKIVAVSGGGRIGPQDYLHTAKVLGVHYTFSKPFEMRQMLDAVRKLTGVGKECV
jgi:DNA-binding response OmpR family regulator